MGTEVLANCAVAAPAAKGTSALTCALPPGTGSAVLVAAANSVKTSARLPLVGYASPTVQRVGHIQCISTNDLELTNCPRAGEGYLTVIGTLNHIALQLTVERGVQECGEEARVRDHLSKVTTWGGTVRGTYGAPEAGTRTQYVPNAGGWYA